MHLISTEWDRWPFIENLLPVLPRLFFINWALSLLYPYGTLTSCKELRPKKSPKTAFHLFLTSLYPPPITTLPATHTQMLGTSGYIRSMEEDGIIKSVNPLFDRQNELSLTVLVPVVWLIEDVHLWVLQSLHSASLKALFENQSTTKT